MPPKTDLVVWTHIAPLQRQEYERARTGERASEREKGARERASERDGEGSARTRGRREKGARERAGEGSA
jgi:hypothetical protein